MTRNELELLNMIRDHDNPEIALETALDTIISYLEQCESFGEPFVAYLPELT
jgi:hypothetical protein